MSEEWTARRFAWLAAGWAAVGILLRLPALRTPFILDDFMLVGMDERVFWTPRPPWDRFRFISGDPAELKALVSSGALPWWADPKLKLAMFRPISSLVSWGELRVYGANPTLSHGLSLALLGVLVWAVALVYRQMLPWRVAKFALPIYVLCRAHDIPVGWIANRSAILAAIFGALCLHGHVRWRRNRDISGLAQSVLCLALSLASGEYGVATFGLLLGFELFGARPGTLGGDAASFVRKRWRSLLPALAIGVVYGAASRALGYGTHATGVYADPRTESTRFIVTTLTNVPRLIFQVLWPSPIHGWQMVLGNVLVISAIGLASTALSETAKRFALAAALTGAIATLPLGLVAVPNPRLVELPEMAFSAAFGTILAGIADDGRRLVRATSWFLRWLVFFLAPLLSWLDMALTQSTSSALYEQAMTAPLSKNPEEDVIFVAAPEVFTVRCPPMARHIAGLSMPRAWWALSVSHAAHRLTRVADDAVELEILGTGLFDDPRRDTYQPPLKPLEAGARVDAGRYSATVLSVGRDGPTRIRFQFPESLDDRRVTMLTSSADGYRRLSPPPVGASVLLPPAVVSAAIAPALRY